MRNGTAVVTIVARNYLAQAKTLMASLERAEPSIDRYVFVIDGTGTPEVGAASPLTPADVFDFEHYVGLACSFDVTEFSTCVKPFVLRYLLGRGYARALYFDPDIEVFDSLAPVVDPLLDGNIVLTPHITEPIPLDGRMPDEIVLLRAGAYNLGFIGFANTKASRDILDWWAERLERYCVNDVSSGLFTDQKWIDLVPGLVDRVAVVRHRGCNVAYWNAHSRRIDLHDIERLATGERIVFYHYSGFDARFPGQLSVHHNRLDIGEEPGRAALLSRYAERLMANGHAETSAVPYGFARFSNGVALDVVSRSLLRNARVGGYRFPDPFDVLAEPSAWRYLNEQADDSATARPAQPLTRYLYEIWRVRGDLRGAFSDPLGADNAAFTLWLRHTGHVPERAYLAEAGISSPVRAGRSLGTGVNVAGYFRTESGVGEAARGQVLALHAAGVPTRLIDFSAHAPERDGDTRLIVTAGRADQPINLVCVNADQVPAFLDHVSLDFFRGRYSIGRWWWELPQFPDRWSGSFAPFDEIWAGTQFIVSAIAAKSSVPVVLVPPVVSVGSVRGGRKADFGWRADETVFLFAFDYHSVVERKNPVGTIGAFRRAFPRGDESVRLVLKSVNAQSDPAGSERVRAAASGDSRIELLDGYVGVHQKNELIAACDAYVSLHRSEGFGYTLAEAMALGKPVIGTPWSGPADYLTRSNSFPVAFELVELADDHGPYTAGQMWAEPDLDDAATAMRSIHEHPAQAAVRGERARADIVARYSPVAVGALVAGRVGWIADRLSSDVGHFLPAMPSARAEDVTAALLPG